MPKHTYTETKIIRDIATIMAKNPGPFTRKMLAEHLSKIYGEAGGLGVELIEVNICVSLRNSCYIATWQRS